MWAFLKINDVSFIMKFILSLCVCFLLIDRLYAKTNKEYQVIFNQARVAVHDNDLSNYYKLKAQLKSYVLYPYLQYLEIVNHFNDLKPQTIENYLNENKNTFWGVLVKSAWLNYLGKTENWPLYFKYGSKEGSLSNQCWYYQSLYEEKSKAQAIKDFTSIWLYGRSLPQACDFLVAKWQGSKYDTQTNRFKRILLALDKREYSLAQFLSYSLSKSDQQFVLAWIDADKDPHFSLNNFLKFKNHFFFSQALIQVWHNYADDDPVGAAQAFEKLLKSKFKISQQTKESITEKIAMELARDHDQQALEWLKKVPDNKASSLLWQWRARTAILWQKWPELVNWIEKMPKFLKEKDQWQYWLAVGLYHTGQKQQSNEIWQKIAKERSYYGFLSADQIGVSYNLKTKSYTVSDQLLKKVQNYDDIQAAYQLYQLGNVRLADSYWRWIIKRYNKPEQLAAAIIAYQWKIYSMAIYAYGYAGYYDDLTHRFPIVYKNYILKYAKKYKVDPAWVWALMRQESYFHQGAVSSAGARGLMQLMPTTASFVAKRFKIPYAGTESLFNPKVNIELGIANLNRVYHLFGNNMAVATAAYNAGHGNAMSWLPPKPVKAQRWVESVPFLETRKYIRQILTYTVIYQNVMLGENIRIRDLMSPVIDPNA